MPSNGSSRHPLFGKKVLITAGPTREYWDPVRFLTNASSGLMGLAIAQEAQRLGARVTVVLGPVDSAVAAQFRHPLKTIPVVTALDMDAAVQKLVRSSDVFISAAAVADFRPANRQAHKIKKGVASPTLKLLRNPDILAKVARLSSRRPAVVVGFALETQQVEKRAHDKLERKRLDWIVANHATNIGQRSGAVALLHRSGIIKRFRRASKPNLAHQLWKALLSAQGM